MSVDLRALTGAALAEALDDVARLRIAVFRDWPYLYDGDVDYERRYLQSYRDSANALIVGAFDGATLIGAATGTPMEDHGDEFAAAFAATSYSPGDIFYCAESVLLPAYRGRGLGHAFFDFREDHARRIGRTYAAFCAVMRPDDHPLCPPGHRPLDAFWAKRGYAPLAGAIATYSWRDLGEAAETEKPMQFWIKTL
ncbi:MAG: GNAT family N-acetyltransferase [Rhodobacteraceae bacterium]|nr:GNAT family N-acetyltransferase [Paracoccaceae bacterium]